MIHELDDIVEVTVPFVMKSEILESNGTRYTIKIIEWVKYQHGRWPGKDKVAWYKIFEKEPQRTIAFDGPMPPQEEALEIMQKYRKVPVQKPAESHDYLKMKSRG